jgi:hypothetical protein
MARMGARLSARHSGGVPREIIELIVTVIHPWPPATIDGYWAGLAAAANFSLARFPAAPHIRIMAEMHPARRRNLNQRAKLTNLRSTLRFS